MSQKNLDAEYLISPKVVVGDTGMFLSFLPSLIIPKNQNHLTDILEGHSFFRFAVML